MTESAPRPLDESESRAWTSLIAVAELLPGVLDSQLQRDAGLSHFEYMLLGALRDAPNETLRMTALAARTNATLPRLSHVASRLERRGLIARRPCPEDGRATNASLTEAGGAALDAAVPGHLATVRSQVLDTISPEQLEQLAGAAEAILGRIDPFGRFGTACPSTSALAQPDEQAEAS
jgi:DNA-binding MarR family transcriptional regulator